MKATKRIAMVLAVGVFLGLGASAQGAALVYESMNHTIGAGQLHGKTPDAGLGAWVVSPTGAGQIIAPSATYTDGNSNVLPVAGSRFESVAGHNDLGYTPIDVSLWSAGNKDGGKLNTAGAEIWFSALMQANGSGYNRWWLRLTDSAGGGLFQAGKQEGNANWQIEGTNDDGAFQEQISSNSASDDVDFLLGRLTTDGSNNTTFDLWIDPLLDTAPGGVGTGDLSIVVVANGDASATQFDRIGYRHQKWESPNILDEIRMGETFNSVVGRSDAGPIPEPATMCALGLAVCGLGGYVRRRRKA